MLQGHEIASVRVDLGRGAGALELVDSDGFSGAVTGFGSDDVFRFRDIDAGAESRLNYLAGTVGDGCILTATDGTDSATIELHGTFDPTKFGLTWDNAGHALVTYETLLLG